MAKLPLCCELHLPADLACLHLARSFVRDTASLAGLAEGDAEGLVLAADEACTNVVEHAFEPGDDDACFIVRAEVNAAEVIVSVLDRGIPFDPPPSTGPPPPGGRGLGFHLIQHSVDRLEWIRHGKEGKELRLVKRHRDLAVMDRLPPGDLTPYASSSQEAPHHTYEVRRLRPEDALQVARVLYRTYGYTYPNEDLYYPERIVRMNEAGQLISIVSQSDEGEIVGHYALEMPEPSRVAECGLAVVVPAHRGGGLLNLMRGALEREAKAMGLSGLFGQPVTSHTLSQQMNESFGSKVCGATLGLVPRSFSFKGIRTQLPQRETTMLYFKPLEPIPPTVAHAPARHRDILSVTYSRLGLTARFGDPAAVSGESRAKVRFNPSMKSGFIRVHRIGDTTAGEVRRARRELCEHANAEVVFLELPLAQPACALLCETAEEEGFFYSGLGPCFFEDGDALRLQYLNCELDADAVKVYSPFGKEILEYIEGERKRVSE